jgi:hypothetical protein
MEQLGDFASVEKTVDAQLPPLARTRGGDFPKPGIDGKEAGVGVTWGVSEGSLL